jgi:hypothetical protein
MLEVVVVGGIYSPQVPTTKVVVGEAAVDGRTGLIKLPHLRTEGETILELI